MYFTSRSLEQTIEQDLDFAIGIADRLVGTKMDLMKTEAITVAAHLRPASSDTELIELMVEQYNEYTDISALAVFDRDGLIASYSVPAHSHDLNLHADYLEMVYEEGATIISSPFYCSTNGEFVMNVYTHMGNGGILAVTMPGQTFSDMLSEQRLWQTGNIFMLNEVGMFIGATDQESVQAMNDYVLNNDDNSGGADEEISGLVQKILSSDKGVEQYLFEGTEYLCAHSRINSSALGWCVAVTVPINASPQADALRGQFSSAVVFLILGVAAAFFLSRVTSEPFKEIKRQNRDLAELNAAIQAQANSIREEHERVRLMMDATPLACRLWNRNLELIEGNEAAVKLFGLRDKQEYLDRYFELSPEYQPDGRATRDKIKETVTEAFDKGECTYDWLYRLSDGTPLPCEVTMVRIPYGDDYVVAAYSRDLREHKKMLADIEHRDELLEASRLVSFTLFGMAEDGDIEEALTESLKLLGQCVGIDQAYITQNETVDDIEYFSCRSAWINDADDRKSAIVPGMRFPWGLDDDWDARFRQGECMNGPVKDLPLAIQKFFAPFETKSVLVIPVFVQEQFWGLVGFSDCGREHSFGADEVDILQSMSLMMATAVSRNEQATRIREAHHRIRLLTNATPLGFNLWDKKRRNIETNDTAVSLFGLESQQEYLQRFFELSPAYQPDGRPSKETAFANIDEAFDKGQARFEWMHQTLDGTPVPSELTLVRLPYDDGHVVAGYIRDLREYKQMLAGIERRDYLRTVVNQAADVLLRADPDEFSDTLQQCMGMMTEAINADRMYLFKNHTENGRLSCTQLYEWSGDIPSFRDTGMAVNICYDETIPKIKEMLVRGEYVHSLVRDLSPAGREWLGGQEIKAILFVPVFTDGEFWGFVGFGNCHSEQLFTETEESIMRSGGLLVAAAFLRNEYLLGLRDSSAKLEAALAEAEQANNATSSFLAHMSHEIR
ncbi:MAG: GAF domain-containing protein, partial [Oscillospiraceae bacterium]|nr:GAF domain-containing protein [Oscillospiraceae bacterium]